MRKQIEERTCNYCGKVAVGNFEGWLYVDGVLGSFFKYASNRSPWDFCSAECCINFLQPMTLVRGVKDNV